jgi:excinuclease UvrABC nuclease subunit
VQCFHSAEVTESNWATLWAEGGLLRAYANEPCVYFFFNQEGELLYIGKAEVLGFRMGSHFQGKNSKWREVAKTIGILPVPRDSWFEILAIEAYLIGLLKPSGNNLGKNSRQIKNGLL